MEKISVVIPVYNTERYVGECIDSVMNQNYENIEIVLVNDGSKDNSLLVLNNYKDKYPNNIVVVDKPNGGEGKEILQAS